MQIHSIDQVVVFYEYVYGHHQHANTIDQDGRPCHKCRQPIPLKAYIDISKLTRKHFIKVDRSNRVDVNLRHKTNGKKLVSYHIKCWRKEIFL